MAENRPICAECADYMKKLKLKKGDHKDHEVYRCCKTIYCKTCKKYLKENCFTYEDPVSYLF